MPPVNSSFVFRRTSALSTTTPFYSGSSSVVSSSILSSSSSSSLRLPPFSHTFSKVVAQRKRSFTHSAVLRATAATVSSPSSSSFSDMDKIDTTPRLRQLRKYMADNNIDVYVVPSEDAHQSEYIAACDGRRSWISGFTGSAGTAVVSQNKAALATDGRYFNQAAKQLDSNWELLKQGLEDVPTWQEWTAMAAAGNKIVGVDSTLVTADGAASLRKKILKKGGRDLVGLAENLVDKVWAGDRPARPNKPVKVHDIKYAGRSFQNKLEDLRKELEKKQAAGMIVSMLDDIAWLYNLRGDDIDYNPVFFAYSVVTPSSATLYVDDSRFDAKVKEHLGDHVAIKPYGVFLSDVESLGKEMTASAASEESGPARKMLLTGKSSWAISQHIGANNFDEARSPITEAKAIKNEVEKEGMRQCHIRDGAALSEFFAWLEEELMVKKSKMDEVQAADQLEAFRKKQDMFVGLSFDTISSTGPNAAVIHYKPEPGLCSTIDPHEIYLCDSGAQYLDGTTDTTRTMHFGTPSPMEVKAYTLVLKGVIGIDQAVFPRGTNGLALDVLARQHLWREGLDYRHGTGHGVGSYLNVHEGPIGIGTRLAFGEVALSPGNVLSDEPGYYEDGKFGIRIENIVMAREVKTAHQFGEKPCLGFEHVTMTPLCRKLIDTKLLTDGEKQWINDYHREIWQKTSGFFNSDERTSKWLTRECAPL